MALGGNSAAVIDEWCRLNRVMVRDATLRALPLEELYSCAFIHFQYTHFNILLLRLVHASAFDVVLADCGAPSLLPSLKQESELYRGSMLLFLVSQAWLTFIRKYEPFSRLVYGCHPSTKSFI